MDSHSPKDSRLGKNPYRSQMDPNESKWDHTFQPWFIMGSLGANQSIPQKAMQNH